MALSFHVLVFLHLSFAHSRRFPCLCLLEPHCGQRKIADSRMQMQSNQQTNSPITIHSALMQKSVSQKETKPRGSLARQEWPANAEKLQQASKGMTTNGKQSSRFDAQ